MKIKTLEYFITVAESRSINEAAKKLYIAQPSLTKSLQSLENELGCTLLYRDSAGIRLTEEGEKLLPEARQVVAYYNGWLAMSRQSSLQAIRIYIQYSFPNFLLPDVLLKFKKKYPDVQIYSEICCSPQEYISQDVDQPVLALFVCGPGNPIEECAKRQGNPPAVLFNGEYRCLLNSQSSLADKRYISPEDLAHHVCALRSNTDAPSPALIPLLNWLLPVISSKQVIGTESVDSVIKLVEAHSDVYGLSYYPVLNRYEGIRTGKLTSVPFVSDCGSGAFCLFYSKRACHKHPELQSLVDEIQASAQEFLAEVEDL